MPNQEWENFDRSYSSNIWVESVRSSCDSIAGTNIEDLLAALSQQCREVGTHLLGVAGLGMPKIVDELKPVVPYSHHVPARSGQDLNSVFVLVTGN